MDRPRTTGLRARTVQQFDRFHSRRFSAKEIQHSAKPRAALDNPSIVNSGRILASAGRHLIAMVSK